MACNKNNLDNRRGRLYHGTNDFGPLSGPMYRAQRRFIGHCCLFLYLDYIVTKHQCALPS